MRFTKHLIKIAFGLLISVNASILIAAPNLPAGVVEQIDPGRTAEELSDLPDLIEPPTEQQIIKLPKTNQQFTELDTENIKFKLKAIKITGNSVFSQKQLKKFYQNKIGQVISLKDLQEIANNITDYYREAGYILTQVIIPEQEINDGRVILQVIEGHIDKVSIEGVKARATKNLLRKYGQQILKNKPLKLKDLERYSLLANDIPGIQIRTVINASTDNPGAATLTFVASEKRYGLDIGANNFNSELLGREQISANLYANALAPGSQTGVRGIISAKKNRLTYYALNHRQVLSAQGLTFSGSISDTKTKPKYTEDDFIDLNTPGDSFLVLANLYYPIIRQRAKNFSVGAAFTYINTHTDIEDTRLFKDRIRSIGIKLAYDFLDRFDSTNSCEIIATQGIDVLGASANPPSRPGGKTEFTKFELHAHRYQRIYAQKLFLFLGFKSQYSLSDLLSAEKFGFGGAYFGYGYDPAAIAGDHGISGRIEMQYHLNRFTQHIQMSQLFIFSDGGIVWNRNKLIQPSRSDATSAGGGLRIAAIKNLNVELICAKPFNRLITNDLDDFRFIFNVNYSL